MLVLFPDFTVALAAVMSPDFTVTENHTGSALVAGVRYVTVADRVTATGAAG